MATVITLSSASTTQATTSKTAIPATGAITLFSPQGAPLGLLHARTLTAFRTALASLCVVARRRTGSLRTLVVFGGGEQAYWHVRLALLARGEEVKRVVFVGRRRGSGTRSRRGDKNEEEEREKEAGPSSGEVLVRRFALAAESAVARGERWAGCQFSCLPSPEDGDDAAAASEYDARVAEVLREADVVFCCTPSTEPLWDGRVWDGEEASSKGRLVVAIGSYTPEMREIPGEIVKRALTEGDKEAGVVVVDTIDGALTEAGELIEAGSTAEQLVE